MELTELYTVVLPRVFVPVDCPSCVTVTVRLRDPAETVTVADLELVPVFAEVAVTVIVPLLDPSKGETLSQLPVSVILQLVFDVTVNVPLDPDADPNEILVGDTFNTGVVPPGV